MAITTGTALAVPPKVVKALPDNGDVNVDPSLTEIRITFSQPMDKGGWSFVGGGETYPEVTGQPRWVGSTTVVLPVKLVPDHEYWLSINNEHFRNFKGVNGEAAEPYPIRFVTGGAGGEHAAVYDQLALNGAAVDALGELLTTRYSHRDRLGIDWKALVEQHRDELKGTANADAFARIAGIMLAKAEDKHIWFQVGTRQIPTYMRPVAPNVNPPLLPTLVPNYERLSDYVAMGRWDDGVGYIAIDTWDSSQREAVEKAYEALGKLHDARAIIVDVRANGGGDETLAQGFAGCFIDDPVLYAKSKFVDPKTESGFGAELDRTLEPNAGRPKYEGPVVVLSGPVVMSSCEAFVLMMKAAPRATVVGGTTQGSSGNPKSYDLGNGVTVWVPSWESLTPDGEPFEGKGIEPDVAVEAPIESLFKGDPVLTKGLEVARSKAGG
ncbi:MAG: S41 family peptidase [Phycisphaerales bacterium]